MRSMNRHIKMVMLFFVAVAGLTLLAGNNNAFAASKTWTGGGADNNWSTAANWSPSGAPVSGDTLTFNNLTITGGKDDITGLSVAGINFTGTATANQFEILTPLTVTGDINNTANTSAAILGDITLGADIKVSGVEGLTTALDPVTAGDGHTLNLNGHTLTLNQAGSMTMAIDTNITGSGGLTIDVGTAALFLKGTNTYSGTTTLVAAGDVTPGSGGNSATMFGSSSIIVSPNATLSIVASANMTFSNPITFQPASKNGNVYGNQLMIWNSTGAITVTIPNITLQGNARFGVNDPGNYGTVVNLAGITTNGHCVQYGSEDNTQAANFQNGPTACVIAATGTVPGVPNTGDHGSKEGLIIAVTAIVAVLGLGSAFVLKTRHSTSR